MPDIANRLCFDGEGKKEERECNSLFMTIVLVTTMDEDVSPRAKGLASGLCFLPDMRSKREIFAKGRMNACCF